MLRRGHGEDVSCSLSGIIYGVGKKELFAYNRYTMKKVLTVLASLLVVLSLHASVSLTAGANPQLLYDGFPHFNLESYTENGEYKELGFYTTVQDVYYRYYDRDSFFDIGFRVDDEHFRLVFDIDFRQTLNSFYRRDYYSNIPYRFDILNDILDLNFPRYAYSEITFDKFFVSVGRRPISWGAGSHQFAISKDVPFLDNIWGDYTTPLGNGSFTYNFVLISFNRLGLRNSATRFGTVPEDTSQVVKTVAAHRVEWNQGAFRVSLGELNLIYNRYPDFFDINPFAVYHNLYQQGSNVMLYLEAEGIIDLPGEGKLRLFGEFEMDDFSLPTEEEKGKPTAFGAGGGVQWHIADGDDSLLLMGNSEKYRLSTTTYEFRTGLNLTYGIYFCNPYNYNREVDAGKFTVPLHTDGNTDLYEPNALYLGFKYGPNSLYQELKAEYESGSIGASLSFAVLIRGNGYTIDSPYGESTIGTGEIDYDAVYTLNGERMTTLLLNAGVRYLYAPGLQIEASVEAAFDTYNKKNAVSVTLGHRIDFMSL